MKDLNSYIADVRKIKDSGGAPVDEGIVELVAALHMHGFHTSGSCEGHDNEYGLFYPFVTLSYPEPEGYDNFEYDDESDEFDALREYWLQQNLSQQEKLIILLQEFYQGKEITNLKTLLVLNTFGPGICDLRCYGSDLLVKSNNFEDELAQYRAEFDKFREFLKKDMLYSPTSVYRKKSETEKG